MSKTGARETDLWRWLRRAVPLLRERLHLQRVENRVGSGVPDVEGCLSGRAFWIELKCAAEPPEGHLIRPRFQASQVPWLKRRWAAGGVALVLLQVGKGHSARRYLLSPPRAEALAKKGLTERALRASSFVSPDCTPEDILRWASMIVPR